MKGRVILIDEPAERASQAALLVDGRLEDLLLDPRKGDTTPAPGEIYWAKVDRLVPKMHGAFVRLTPEHTGFLREAKGLKEGRGVLVQVVAYAEPGKATPVTTRVLYKGRRIIHTPDAPGVNVSRQIKDDAERQRLTSIIARVIEQKLAEARAPAKTPEELEKFVSNLTADGESETGARNWVKDFERSFDEMQSDYVEIFEKGGFILRSAASGAPEDELIEELERVVIRRLAPDRLRDRNDSPQLVDGRAWAFDHFIREWCWPVPNAIVACPTAYRVLSHVAEVEDFPKLPSWREFCSRELLARLQRFDGPDLFDHYGVREEIERLQSPRVELPSGGWMAVEATRAMVTVDVNTAAEFSAGAALTANIEAARELPRQLRLRGLGGQVIVDFAPLRKTDRKRIEEALKAAFRRDPVETTLAGWTPLGHFELQRKRERRPLTELLG